MLLQMSKWRSMGVVAALAALTAIPAHAFDNYVLAHISRVSFVDDHILIMIDSAPPTNCVGTNFGWLMIPATSKAEIAFVTGLWMRGDADSKLIAIYTTPRDGTTGFCPVTQIDTESGG